MTKKAKTKTKNDESPPKTTPPDNQSAESCPNPDQKVTTAPPAAAATAPQPASKPQPVVGRAQDVSAAAASDTKSGEPKPQVAAAQPKGEPPALPAEVVSAPAQKSPPLTELSASDGGSKPPSVPVQGEPPREQVIPSSPQHSLESPVGDLVIIPSSSENINAVLEDKSSKPSAPPKTQDVGKDSADKIQKVTPATAKAVPSNQSSKKPGEKPNKRQVAKESILSNSAAKGDPTVSKLPEVNINQSSHDKVIEKPESGKQQTKTAKDNNMKVEEVANSKAKEEPNKIQLPEASSKMLTKQSGGSDASIKVSDPDSSKQKNSSTKNTVDTPENVKSAEKVEISKDLAADGNTAEQKVESHPAAQRNQQKLSSAKTGPSEKVNKNTPIKKNKQKNETRTSKPEVTTNSKETEPADNRGKKDSAGESTGAQSFGVVNEESSLPAEPDNSKESFSNISPHSMTTLPTLEAIASDHLTKAKENDKKEDQQVKVTQDSNEGNRCPVNDDAQSKLNNKKKNRQQKKSISEDVKPAEKIISKDAHEVGKSKSNEKKKPTAATSSKEKESTNASASAAAEKNRKNLSGESVTSGVKHSSGKSSKTEQEPPVTTATTDGQLTNAANDSASKVQVVHDESQSEEQSASKKKKRNRHKNKNKSGDSDSAATSVNAEGAMQQDKKISAHLGEVKAKDKDQTAASRSNKSKGQQKDVQLAQPNASKGTRPGPGVAQRGQVAKQTLGETPAEEASEAMGQSSSAKKRNRRKKKGTSDIEKDSSTSLPQESKSVEPSGANPEEQKEKTNTQPVQTRVDDVQKKKSDPKATTKIEKPQQQDVDSSGDGAAAEGTDDQFEKFVEVKSKNKRNKKKKLDAAEAKEESARALATPNDTSNAVPEISIDGSSEGKGKTGTGNSESDSAKEVTSKVAAPKISQEAREQKMLNRKLAERAQQKIQKQIESNALSEVEKSEKYLESITKNLKELTKLRSSRLEDVLQKSGDGNLAEEEFEYEYAPVQRTTFLATTCHVCKESKTLEIMRNCDQCHLVSYCSEEHQKSESSVHKDFCLAISDICKERGTNNLYAPTVGLSAEEYRRYRMNALLECSAILNRQLEPYEQEMLLYPNVCHTCHLPSPAKLQTCEMCNMVSYCSLEHKPPNHDVWCHDLQLYKSLIIYQSRNGVISPMLPVFLPETFQPPNGDMQSHMQTLLGSKDASPLERAVLSEIATGPLTALFALHKANKVCNTTERLVVHFVGAEWSFELERADKWEAFLLHLVPNLKTLVLVFVGPEVCNLPQEARGLLEKQSRLCPQCQEKGRTVEMVIAPQSFYHEYAASQNYIPPDIICALNAGLYRPNGYKEVDSWGDTLGALLKDPGVPVAVTSYTAEEVLQDTERLQQHRPLNLVLSPSQNPYRSLRPNRNFASDDVTPVIFKNYYIMVATSLTL